jgi:hypothetical protein
MKDLIALYRWAAIAGDRALTERLAPVLRADPALSTCADRDLRELPRGPARWSVGGEQAVALALARAGRRTIEPE